MLLPALYLLLGLATFAGLVALTRSLDHEGE
jgi:hypothetical protein